MASFIAFLGVLVAAFSACVAYWAYRTSQKALKFSEEQAERDREHRRLMVKPELHLRLTEDGLSIGNSGLGPGKVTSWTLVHEHIEYMGDSFDQLCALVDAVSSDGTAIAGDHIDILTIEWGMWIKPGEEHEIFSSSLEFGEQRRKEMYFALRDEVAYEIKFESIYAEEFVMQRGEFAPREPFTREGADEAADFAERPDEKSLRTSKS